MAQRRRLDRSNCAPECNPVLLANGALPVERSALRRAIKLIIRQTAVDNELMPKRRQPQGFWKAAKRRFKLTSDQFCSFNVGALTNEYVAAG